MPASRGGDDPHRAGALLPRVVRVDSLDDAVKYVTVTTIGFAPAQRMADYGDRLGSGGAQRVCRLGEAGPSTVGNPWDAMYPLRRFVHWLVNEDGVVAHDAKDDEVYVNP